MGCACSKKLAADADDPSVTTKGKAYTRVDTMDAPLKQEAVVEPEAKAAMEPMAEEKEAKPVDPAADVVAEVAAAEVAATKG